MTETTVTTGNDVAVLDTDNSGSAIAQEIRNLATNNVAFFSTITGTSFEDRVATIEAMTNSEPIKQNLDKTINLVNVIVQSVPMVDQTTGEIQDQPRIVLLDANGSAYHAISGGLWRSVQNILGILPHPSTWPAPLPMHIVSVKGRQGDFYTAKMGSAPTKK